MKKTLVYRDENTVFEAHVSTEQDYFSVTGDLFTQNTQRGEPTRLTTTGRVVWLNAFGCLHKEVLTHFPRLAPFVAYHLARTNGVPIHYTENAVYWAQEIVGVTPWKRRPHDPDPTEMFQSTVVFDPRFDSMPDLLLPTKLREHANFQKAAREHVRKVVTAWCVARLPRLESDAERLLAEFAREDFVAFYSAKEDAVDP